MATKLKPLRKTKSEILPPPKKGEILEGTVVSIERNSLFLDLGARGIGIIYGAEFYKAKEILKDLKPGDKISAKLTNLENENGYRELSVIDASKEFIWKELQEIKEKDEQIEVKIKKVNKGGLMTDIKNMPAFLPVSHLTPEHYPKIQDGDITKIAKALQQFIGQTLKVKIIDLDPKKEKIILSEKLGAVKKEEESLKEYKVGDIVEGKVTGITNFGAFIKLDKNIEGLLYPSEVSSSQSKEDEKKIENILKIGQKVKVKIIKIADNQIYLSLKI